MPDALNPYPDGYATIRIHKIAAPDQLAAQAERIGRLGFGVDSAGTKVFSIQPASGFLYYADRAALWQNPAGDGLPIAAGETEAIVRRHLARINAWVALDAALRKIGLGALFPTDLRLIDSMTIPHPDTARTDHLLCRFSVWLPTGLDGPVAVDGAAVEARIGRDGALLALSTRWRPVVAQTVSRYLPLPANGTVAAPPLAVFDPPRVMRPVTPQPAAIMAPAAPAPPARPGLGDESDSHDDAGEAEPELIYSLQDGNAPQAYYSPYYIQRVGHHGSMRVASAHSLMVDVLQQATADGAVTVRAAVSGGSGTYLYEWYRYSVVDFADTGLEACGTAETMELGRGYFNIILRVSDPQTDQVMQIERTIYV